MSWKHKLAGVGVILVGIVLLIGATIAISQIAQPIQSGTYEGQTIDYSHQRGLIFQTNDLTTKTHERSSAREDWCVPDTNPELVEKVRNIPEGSEVKIEYYRPLWVWPDTCNGGLKIIEEITVINASSS